ncbi:hypothetical protein [Solihabitans fulvus]|nr:hypothetical protein [Solihabitans fulvus]
MVDKLMVLVEAYRAAETAGTSTRTISHAGWHPGARLGANTPDGELLAYNDSGDEASCVLRAGQRTLCNVHVGGHGRDFTERPYTVWSVSPGLTGALAPHAVKLELIGDDETAIPADVVAHTFAVETAFGLPSERRLSELRATGTASKHDEVTAVWEVIDEAREKLRELTVRVYDNTDTVLYEGPALTGDK